MPLSSARGAIAAIVVISAFGALAGPAGAGVHLVAPTGTAVPLLAALSDYPYPNDYLTACNAVKATICLYVPAGTKWVNGAGEGSQKFWDTIDAVVPEDICTQTGGKWALQKYCIYYYPTVQSFAFVPGPSGFSESGTCNTGANESSETIDAHGVAQIGDAGAFHVADAVTPGDTPPQALCYVTVYK